MALLEFDLDKVKESAEKLVLNLQKLGVASMPLINAVFLVDISGSFKLAHWNPSTEVSLVNELIKRLFFWAFTFDPDKKMDVVTFSAGRGSATHVGFVNIDNAEGFVLKYIYQVAPGWGGGTNYFWPIRKALQIFGWLPDDDSAGAPAPKKGLLARMGFGGGDAEPGAPGNKKCPEFGLALMLTDGANQDETETRQLLEQIKAQAMDIYLLIIGVNPNEDEFDFVKSVGKDYDFVGFYQVNNVQQFVDMTDEQINDALIFGRREPGQDLAEEPEFVKWLNRVNAKKVMANKAQS